MSQNAAPNPTANLNARFTTLADQLIEVSGALRPSINPAAKEGAITLATEIGELDGTRHPHPPQVAHFSMPSEDLIRDHARQAAQTLGQKARNAVSKSKAGDALASRDLKLKPEPKGLLAMVRRHGWTLAIFIAALIIEYMVGISVMNQVFSLTDNNARLMALVTPVVTTLVFFALAQAISVAREGWRKPAILAFGIAAAAFILTYVITTGLIMSGVISGGEASAVDPTAPVEESPQFHLVKLVAYIALMFGISAVVAGSHLRDLQRDYARRIAEDSAAQEAVMTATETAQANAEILTQYIDIYQALMGARANIIASYVAGVNQHLDHAARQTGWPSPELSAEPPEPAWVEEIRTEVTRLRSTSVAPATLDA
jgi:uncharacterized membrane protein YozB (DUF420 family)